MEPRLSVLMACYMQEKYVAEAIDSVLASKCDFSNTELILWDDGSTDGTYAILEKYRKRHPDFIKLHRSPKNLGVADCAAEMVKAARGKYFMIFDHDDVMLPFDVNSELDFMDANPEYSASYGRKFMFDENGLQGKCLGGPYTDFMMLLHPPINNNAMIVRRQTALEVGNYKSTSLGKKSGAADLFMWLRLRLAGKLRYDPQVRLLHRIHPAQVTSRQNQYDVYVKDYQFLCDYLGEKHPGLYEKLKARKNVSLTEDERPAALMLLGGLIRDEPNPRLVDCYLFFAKQLAPNDCDVEIQIGELAYRIERYEDALTHFFEAFVSYEDDYFRMLICNWIFRCYEKLGRKLDGLLPGSRTISNRFFGLPPESQAVVNNLKKYE